MTFVCKPVQVRGQCLAVYKTEMIQFHVIPEDEYNIGLFNLLLTAGTSCKKGKQQKDRDP